jgi:hypothetical protein
VDHELPRGLESTHHLDEDIDSGRKHVSDIRGERQAGTESRLGSIPDERSDTADVDAGASQAAARPGCDACNGLTHASIAQQADANWTYVTPGLSIDPHALDGRRLADHALCVHSLHRHTSPFSARVLFEKGSAATARRTHVLRASTKRRIAVYRGNE